MTEIDGFSLGRGLFNPFSSLHFRHNFYYAGSLQPRLKTNQKQTGKRKPQNTTYCACGCRFDPNGCWRLLSGIKQSIFYLIKCRSAKFPREKAGMQSPVIRNDSMIYASSAYYCTIKRRRTPKQRYCPRFRFFSVVTPDTPHETLMRLEPKPHENS